MEVPNLEAPSSCPIGLAAQTGGGHVQCGAVWLNGGAAHCQHLSRPVHGIDAELERYGPLTTTEYTAVGCRWLQLSPYGEHREEKSPQVGITHLRLIDY